MTTNNELKYEKNELRKMLIAVLDLHGGKIEVPYSQAGADLSFQVCAPEAQFTQQS